MKGRRNTPADFWGFVRVEEVERVAGLGPCWIWIGARVKGYGVWRYAGKMVKAHQWAFARYRAWVPGGLIPDHLCRVRECCNPWHLEPVTHRENILRGEAPPARLARRQECNYGHPLDGYNERQGRRYCKTCKAAYQRKWRAAVRLSAGT